MQPGELMQLRCWAVEMAVQVTKDPKTVVSIAKEIHDWVMKFADDQSSS